MRNSREQISEMHPLWKWYTDHKIFPCSSSKAPTDHPVQTKFQLTLTAPADSVVNWLKASGERSMSLGPHPGQSPTTVTWTYLFWSNSGVACVSPTHNGTHESRHPQWTPMSWKQWLPFPNIVGEMVTTISWLLLVLPQGPGYMLLVRFTSVESADSTHTRIIESCWKGIVLA